jgi:hypothetical protein
MPKHTMIKVTKDAIRELQPSTVVILITKKTPVDESIIFDIANVIICRLEIDDDEDVYINILQSIVSSYYIGLIIKTGKDKKTEVVSSSYLPGNVIPDDLYMIQLEGIEYERVAHTISKQSVELLAKEYGLKTSIIWNLDLKKGGKKK